MSVVLANSGKCPLVEELSNCLKEDSRSGIVSCLMRIKTDAKCSKRLLENGGVCLLVELLRYRNTKVMDATLSILANACLLSHVRDKVEGTKIASYVVWITNNLQSGETMHCRACRLMGNLSESRNHALALCDAGAVASLTEILRSRTNAQTLGMAVRAVRNIWTINVLGRGEILDAGTIREIIALLVKSRKRTNERSTSDAKKYEELAETCLKAICVFSDCTDLRMNDQLRGDRGGNDGYRCIVDYCRDNNKTAIKSLYKLSHDAGRRPDLGNSGAIEFLIEYIVSSFEASSRWHDHGVNSPYTNFSSSSSSSSSMMCFNESLLSICMFCREAVNRAKIRRGSGLEAILNLLNDNNNERYHSTLLHALAQFICDDLSIEIMVKHGLVDVIVDNLRKMSSYNNGRRNEDKTRDGKNRKKRTADTSPIGRGGDNKYNRTGSRYGRFSLDYPRVDWSPGGTSTAYSSPPGTPPLAPYDVNSDIDENADDNYSPICSDNEWLENDDTTDVQSDGDLTTRDRLSVKRDNDANDENEEDDEDDFSKLENDENFDDNDHDNNEDEQESASILALLSMLSHSSVPIERLSDPTTIKALVDYIASAKNNRASGILTRIIRNREYFVPLLLQGFVFVAQTLHGTEHYTRALSTIAETGGAFGEIASILLRGKDSQKSIVAVSVPYMIKTREKLRILLNIHGGLELIYNIFKEPKNSIHEDAILSICKLADSLDISTPCNNEKNVEISGIVAKKNIVRSNEETYNERDTTIIFELDDGSYVETRKSQVCDKSQVFAAMLDGNFSESRKNRVRLRKTSYDGLTTLLMAANGNYELNDEKIEAVLDAVILADKFLMPDISERLTEISIERIDHENICRAWTWSRINYCHELRNCCVKIFLTATMSREQRLRAFRDFYETTSFCEFVKDTRDIIDDSLALSRI